MRDQSQDEQALIRIQHEWAEARIKGDISYTQGIEAEDCTIVWPEGRIVNKRADLQSMTGNIVFTEFNIAILLFIVVVAAIAIGGSYNRLVRLQQAVDQSWAQVQNVYQRRADLIPNLVNTVSGAANFEKSTLVEVTNARASVGRVQAQLDPNKAPTDAAQLEKFQAAQGALSNALSRLLVLVER